MSADPLAVHAPGEADLNVYAYVSGAVLKNVDPLGLEEANNVSFEPNQSTPGGGVGDGENTVTTTPEVTVTGQPPGSHKADPLPQRVEPSADQINDQSTACMQGDAIPGARERSGAAAAGAAVATASLAPGVGEAMDVATLKDPHASIWEKGMALFSLGASVVSGTVLPNFGGLRAAEEAASGYSTAHRIELPVDLHGGTRAEHRTFANESLLDTLRADAELAGGFEEMAPGTMDALTAGKNPPGHVWHHADSASTEGQLGVMDLVKAKDHKAPEFQSTLHPDARVDSKNWKV